MTDAVLPNSSPLVCVVLPVRNGAATIGCAIESIRRQSFANWELLLLDDGSDDETAAIVASFADARIRVLQDGRKLGLAARLNQGVDLARGRYLARMDADDVAYPERLGRQVTYLDSHAEIDLLGTRALLFRDDGEPTALFPYRASHAEICLRPWNGFYLPHPTWMGRIEWFRRFPYRMPEVVWAEDQDLLLRAYDSSCFACLPEVLLGYRVRPVPLSRLVRVRVNLARAQFAVNLRAGRPVYAFLGASAFLTKALADTARYLAGGSTVSSYAPTSIPRTETASWSTVWCAVNEDRVAREGIE